MSFLSFFANWSVGVINGYKLKENGLPNGIKYGMMGTTTVASMLRVLLSMNLKGLPQAAIAQKLGLVCFGVPFVVATNFCVGHHFGKAIRNLDDGV